MPINIICPKCANAYAVSEELAGHVVTCAKCRTKAQVPALVAHGPMSLNPRLDRVVGREPPLLFDILGLHTRWSADESSRDALLLIWSLRHIGLLILVAVLYPMYSATRETAASGAAFLFWAGVVMFVISWIQMERTSRNITKNIAGRSPGLVPRMIAALLLVVTDFRAALPALRTLVLSLFLLFAGLRLTEMSGSWANLSPVSLSLSQPTTRPYRPAVSVSEPATAPAPPPPTTTKNPLPPPPPEEGPLPPPKDD